MCACLYKARTFDEGLELLVFHLATLHVDLQSKQHGEHELMHLIQTASIVAEHFKRQVFNDVLDALHSDGGLCRPAVSDSNQDRGDNTGSRVYP